MATFNSNTQIAAAIKSTLPLKLYTTAAALTMNDLDNYNYIIAGHNVVLPTPSALHLGKEIEVIGAASAITLAGAASTDMIVAGATAASIALDTIAGAGSGDYTYAKVKCVQQWATVGGSVVSTYKWVVVSGSIKA